MKYISVEGHSDLVKDKRTGAILNINADFEQLRKNKQKRKQSRAVYHSYHRSRFLFLFLFLFVIMSSSSFVIRPNLKSCCNR